jgi:hypothetical protein
VTSLLSFAGIVGILLLLLVWALRSSEKSRTPEPGPGLFGELGSSNVSYLPQIRRALAEGDFIYLKSTGHEDLARRLRKERRRIALAYLPALKGDFEKMVGFARVIAGMSKEVATVEEWERLLLTAEFYWHYEVVRLGLICGVPRFAGLNGLSEMVSGLAVRMETAIAELNERAAVSMRMNSSLNGSSVDRA